MEYTLRWYWDRAKRDMGLVQDAGFVIHALRHTCATRLVNDEGVDVFTVAKWLGHKNLETTRRYVHINDQSLARARDKLAARRRSLSSPESHKNSLLGESAGGGSNGGGIASPAANARLDEVA